MARLVNNIHITHWTPSWTYNLFVVHGCSGCCRDFISSLNAVNTSLARSLHLTSGGRLWYWHSIFQTFIDPSSRFLHLLLPDTINLFRLSHATRSNGGPWGTHNGQSRVVSGSITSLVSSVYLHPLTNSPLNHLSSVLLQCIYLVFNL